VKTISERIYDTIAGLLWKELITSAEQVDSILREHFCEPWLDVPGGPGWWWLDCPPSQHPKAVLVTEYYGQLYGEGGIPVSFWDDSKWQRVIGPS
jgi:hypothetical protein